MPPITAIMFTIPLIIGSINSLIQTYTHPRYPQSQSLLSMTTATTQFHSNSRQNSTTTTTTTITATLASPFHHELSSPASHYHGSHGRQSFTATANAITTATAPRRRRGLFISRPPIITRVRVTCCGLCVTGQRGELGVLVRDEVCVSGV